MIIYNGPYFQTVYSHALVCRLFIGDKSLQISKFVKKTVRGVFKAVQAQNAKSYCTRITSNRSATKYDREENWSTHQTGCFSGLEPIRGVYIIDPWSIQTLTDIYLYTLLHAVLP